MGYLNEQTSDLIKTTFGVIINSDCDSVNYVKQNEDASIDVYYSQDGEEQVWEFENLTHFFSQTMGLADAANEYLNYSEVRATRSK